MVTVFKTIKKSDALFQLYLDGDIDTEHRAISIKSYNLGEADEAVTFEIRTLKSILKPTYFQLYRELFKIKTFILILFPFFFVLTAQVSDAQFDVLSAGLSVIAALLLFVGLNIRNDALDHYNGFDRVNLDLSHKPIRMGWMTARDCMKLSGKLILLSAFMALPIVLLYPQVLYVVVSAVALFVSGHFTNKNTYKNQHWGELVLYLMMGPLLFVGFELASGLQLSLSVVVLSFIWGWAAMYLVHVNNFVHMMTSSQHNIKNTVTNYGFDLAQKFLIVFWALLICFVAAYFIYFGSHVLVWSSYMALVVFSALLFVHILKIQSPMGSGLLKVKQQVGRVFNLFVVVLTLQCLYELKVFE